MIIAVHFTHSEVSGCNSDEDIAKEAARAIRLPIETEMFYQINYRASEVEVLCGVGFNKLKLDA